MTLLSKLLAPLAVIATLAAGTWFWGGVVAPGYTSAVVLVAAWFVLCSVLFGRAGKARPELRWWLRGTFLACSAVSLVAFYMTSLRDTVVNETLPDAVPASQLASEPGDLDPLAPQPEPGDEEDRDASEPAEEPTKAAKSSRTEASTAAKPKPSATTTSPAAKPKPAASPPPPPPPAPAANVVERIGAVQPTSHSAKGTARVVKLASGGRTLTLSDGFEVDPGPEIRVYLATDASAQTFKDLGKLKGSKGDQRYDIPDGLDLDAYDTVVLYCLPFTVSVAKADLRRA